jgi:hypothetical protein
MSYTNAARFLAPRIIASLQLPQIYIQTIYIKVSQVYAVCIRNRILKIVL